MAVVTLTDRPKLVRSRCVNISFCWRFYVVTLPFQHFYWHRGFCAGTESDIFSFHLLFDRLYNSTTLTKGTLSFLWLHTSVRIVREKCPMGTLHQSPRPLLYQPVYLLFTRDEFGTRLMVVSTTRAVLSATDHGVTVFFWNVEDKYYHKLKSCTKKSSKNEDWQLTIHNNTQLAFRKYKCSLDSSFNVSIVLSLRMKTTLRIYIAIGLLSMRCIFWGLWISIYTWI